MVGRRWQPGLEWRLGRQRREPAEGADRVRDGLLGRGEVRGDHPRLPRLGLGWEREQWFQRPRWRKLGRSGVLQGKGRGRNTVPDTQGFGGL